MLQKKNLLLDHEPDIMESIPFALESMGNCTSATNGLDAIPKAQLDHFGGIL